MPVIKCKARTCIYYKDGECSSDEITLIDFEYYVDSNDYEKDYLEDDMKCITYKSIYSKEKQHEENT